MKKLFVLLAIGLLMMGCAGVNQVTLDLDNQFTENVIGTTDNLKAISANGILKLTAISNQTILPKIWKERRPVKRRCKKSQYIIMLFNNKKCFMFIQKA